MRYSRVYLDSIGYELAPVVVATSELENRLKPSYDQLRLPMGQLETLTGISERRWWEPNFSVSEGATRAARKALQASHVLPNDIDVLIYAGVCREQFEPATACKVAAGIGVSPSAFVYDISNACLGVLNGIIDVANRIELGQCRAGLVVSCETAREINDITIGGLNENPSIERFRDSLATFTGGSGAVAVLVTDGSFNRDKRRRLLGATAQAAPQHHNLCRWGLQSVIPGAVTNLLPSGLPSLVGQFVANNTPGFVKNGLDFGMRNLVTPFMSTDAASVLKHGVDLGMRTFQAFRAKLGWAGEQIDKVICHQVGAIHRDTVLKALGIAPEKDFSTFEYLGNMGTVSLPMTAAIAEERDFLRPGDRVGFMGIGSGLNCLMLGLHW
jgi:3-oxoacyl-[acyl-carrier-protein] synthase III